MAPKVSLLMTVYNREQYLEAAIVSVLAQTYPHYEFILWDDGSTDRSNEIAIHFAQQDPRIKHFKAEHQGRNASLRAAHRQADGTYLGWIDSDDCLTPATLAATVAFLDNEPEVGMVYTDHQTIDAQGSLQGYDHRCKIPYSKDRLLVDFMTFHFRLIRRECFELAGGINPEFKAAIDYDFCLRLSEVTQIKHLQIPLYEYRVHLQRMSSQGRYRQVQYAKAAVEQALVRRGLDKTYRLEVSENAEFILRNRSGHPEGSRDIATIRVWKRHIS
jgi:glycosyltransferase involved in cell wall biosynthesis